MFDLKAMRAVRDEAKQTFLGRRKVSASDLLQAYTEGERDFSRAVLTRAVLRDADLRGAALRDAHGDFLSKCMTRPHGLAGLRAALVEGRVNGQVYEGECACFLGTLANVAHCEVKDLGIERNPASPVERLFMAISEGDTPETNPISKIVVGWLDELTAFAKAFQTPTEAMK